MPEIVLSGALFSKADDCADLVLSFKTLNGKGYFHKSFWSVFENVRLADRTGVGTALSKTEFPNIHSGRARPCASLCPIPDVCIAERRLLLFIDIAIAGSVTRHPIDNDLTPRR
jgi:hypothetical protein